MNKKIFLKNLREKLSILDEDEVNDIISEYSDIIDEKIKNGLDEKDAINDFGDINTLSSEILKAYKLNSKYSEKKDIFNNFESIIKDMASKTSDFIKQTINEVKENNITFEFICEILIKVLALIIICSLLKLPFALIIKLASLILGIIFFPLSTILIFIFSLILWILYFICCILLGIRLFKNNIKSEAKNAKPKKKLKTKKDVKIGVKEEIKEEKIKTKVIKEKKENSLGKIIFNIIKVFLYICFIIPLLFVNVALVAVTVGIIYYLVLGINLWGILLVFIGLLILFFYLTYILYNIFNKKRKFIFPFLVSVILITIGSFISFDTIRRYEYVDYDKNIKIKELNYEIDQITYINLDGPFEIIADENKNNLTIEIIYDEKFAEVNNYEHKNNINLNVHHRSNNFYDIYDEIIENLKNYKIVNYKNSSEVNYKIYAPKEIINKIIVR